MTMPLYVIAIAGIFISFCKDRSKTKQALLKGLRSFENIMPQMLFILLLIGFILSVLTPDQISALLGSESGWYGTIGAICLGAVTLIPPYVSYPLAERLLQNGAGIMHLKMLIKRYKLFLTALLVLLLLHFINPSLAKNTACTALDSFREMLGLLPPIFVLLGLIDVWAPKEVMMRYLGEHAGIKGIIISYLFGAVAAGPLYAAFPVAMMLVRKGCSYRNLMIFMGSWSTIKISMLLYEISSLGVRFTLTRMALNLIGIFVIAQIMNIMVDKASKDELLETAAER